MKGLYTTTMQNLRFGSSDALERTRNEVSKGFTTERKNLGRAIIMQILRFKFSDLLDCPAKKGGKTSVT